MTEPTAYEKIESVMSDRLHKTPEDIGDDVYIKYGTWWKVSNVERRLREMAHKGLITSKVYKNTHNSSSHNRWKRRV